MDDVAKGCDTCLHNKVFLLDEPCESCDAAFNNKAPINWEPIKEEVKNDNEKN